MDWKEVFLLLVKAARKTCEADTVLRHIGYGDTPYCEIYGFLTDAVYALLGEHTDEFSDSITFAAMSPSVLSDEERATMLVQAVAR